MLLMLPGILRCTPASNYQSVQPPNAGCQQDGNALLASGFSFLSHRMPLHKDTITVDLLLSNILTAQAAAKAVKVNTKTIALAIRKGHLPAVLESRTWRIADDDLWRWYRRHRREIRLRQQHLPLSYTQRGGVSRGASDDCGESAA